MIDCANISQTFQEESKKEEDEDDIFFREYYADYYSNEKKKKFEDKFSTFRTYIKSMKISFLEGCDTIHTDRDNTLKDSMEQSKNINFYRKFSRSFKKTSSNSNL